MARSFSNVKILSAVVSDGFSSLLTSRGYAAAAGSQGVASSAVKGAGVAAARSSNLLKKSGEEKVVGSTEKVSWVPDPVTGYYRPENRCDEIDVAELRSILLKNKN
ncbi:indole-3-acetic acid-induced protein ARG2-like [Cucumis melo var. makuwa]|uniref:Indole-3-acetic acid-induced protein ARG2-like n=2 Tax=Cucumis melo TaxID=3656 RepID=A0A1S3BRT2_CUCME|nr:indole-3-acetic acid-induced protein ARG2 [Cucumis melo]KAA0067986.1 indole-3-acetic acid-induced protein ARG2-like [Cucumis melo var. makuwa]TYK18138.1 indole-3-acetic acid-induced protein ARG2-like [Cucumis melo var. makuwa]